MAKDTLKVIRAINKLEQAKKLCGEAVELILKGDPNAPAAHSGYMDDLCGAKRACERALVFAQSRLRSSTHI